MTDDMHRVDYSAASIRAVYDRLGEIARTVLRSGHSVVVDATFLKQAERTRMREIANACNAEFVILPFYATIDELRLRLRERRRAGNDVSDADESVMERQQKELEPLRDDEKNYARCVDDF
jgi:predicted kinase